MLKMARWVLVLPAAFAASWAAYLVVTVLNRLTMGMQGIDADGFLTRIFIEAISSGAMGCAFVFAGAKIAPREQNKVGFGLVAIGLVLAGVMLFPAIWMTNWWAVWSGVSLAAGLVAAAAAIHSGEMKLEPPADRN